MIYKIYVPSKEKLLEVDALLYAVYGWEPNKVKTMKLETVQYWVRMAEKKITWIQAYKFRSLMESKPKTLWQKILSKIKI
jgi:hypothetical protein